MAYSGEVKMIVNMSNGDQVIDAEDKIRFFSMIRGGHLAEEGEYFDKPTIIDTPKAQLGIWLINIDNVTSIKRYAEQPF